MESVSNYRVLVQCHVLNRIWLTTAIGFSSYSQHQSMPRCADYYIRYRSLDVRVCMHSSMCYGACSPWFLRPSVPYAILTVTTEGSRLPSTSHQEVVDNLRLCSEQNTTLTGVWILLTIFKDGMCCGIWRMYTVDLSQGGAIFYFWQECNRSCEGLKCNVFSGL